MKISVNWFRKLYYYILNRIPMPETSRKNRDALSNKKGIPCMEFPCELARTRTLDPPKKIGMPFQIKKEPPVWNSFVSYL